jgi:medium-chain acyl-[acyl-carrier-protein] hydrolase
MNDEGLFRPAPRPRPTLRLFCFPYAGAGAAAFRDWDRGLPAELEVAAVRLPGRESRFLEEPYETLEPMIEALLDVLARHRDVPFAFFGHSLGALVAYELTCALHERAAPLPVHLFASGRVAPHLKDPDGDVHKMTDAQLVQELRERGQTPEEVLENDELLEMLLPAVRADFAVAELYQPRSRPPLPLPLTAFGGTEDPDVPEFAVQAWAEHTRATFAHRMFAGGHFFLDEHREPLLRTIGETLAPALRRP